MKRSVVRQVIGERPEFRYDRLNPEQAAVFVRGALGLLFPHFSDCPDTEPALIAKAGRVEADLTQMLGAVDVDGEEADRVVGVFFDALVSVGACLLNDANFILAGDPAAQSLDEVILAYPGFYATATFRLANVLWAERVPVLPRLMSEHAHAKTGVDIHPGATIGCPFFVDHATGVVIGETTEIGDRVKLYQGVTLGALAVEKGLGGTKRHPTIEDDVVVYASATILGGGTVVGEGSIVGGNVWLTESVPARSVVVHRPEIRVRREDDAEHAIEFHI